VRITGSVTRRIRAQAICLAGDQGKRRARHQNPHSAAEPEIGSEEAKGRAEEVAVASRGMNDVIFTCSRIYATTDESPEEEAPCDDGEGEFSEFQQATSNFIDQARVDLGAAE
jgi:hypothetical protein